MTNQQLLYTLALQHVPKISDITAKKLINHCGSAEAIFKEKKKTFINRRYRKYYARRFI